MKIDSDLNKQIQEIIFSRKILKAAPPLYHFNDAAVSSSNVQKYLGSFLDKFLTFNQHIKDKLAKTMKGINAIRKFSNVLPRRSLVNIYKSFVRTHLKHRLYVQPNNDKSCQRTEDMQ